MFREDQNELIWWYSAKRKEYFTIKTNFIFSLTLWLCAHNHNSASIKVMESTAFTLVWAIMNFCGENETMRPIVRMAIKKMKRINWKGNTRDKYVFIVARDNHYKWTRYNLLQQLDCLYHASSLSKWYFSASPKLLHFKYTTLYASIKIRQITIFWKLPHK